MWLPRSRRLLSRLVALIGVALFALCSVSLAYADFGQPTAITKEASDMHSLFLFVLAVGAAVFVLVEGGLIYAVIRYRRKNDELPPQTHGSTPIEVLWTGIPVLIVISLFTYSFIVLRDVEHPNNNQDMIVDVTGFQFQWQFVYHKNELGPGSNPNAQGDVSIIGTAKAEPTLVIPSHQPIQFRLHSNDVIHAFFIRNFLYKLDVIPGRDNRFTITADKEGEYIGQCAELCGLNHALMRFHVKIVSQAEFAQWIAAQPPSQTAQ